MSRPGRLLLIGATDPTVVRAKDLGLTVVLVQHESKMTELQREHADVLEVMDYTDWAALAPVVARLHDSPGFDVALSLTEPGLENAGRVNDLYRLGGTTHRTSHTLRDKTVMRERLQGRDAVAAQRLRLVPGARPEHVASELRAFGDRVGYPFVVKPVDGTAGVGVGLVRGPLDVPAAVGELRALSGSRTDRGSTMFVLGDFVLEAFLDGPEYSVETFSFSGRHVVVAITEKLTAADHFAELGHAMPARLTPAQDGDIRAATLRFLAAVGLRDGPCHVELRLTAQGPKIVEGQNRLSGGLIPELVRAVYGVDLVTYAVAWPFGLVAELPDRPEGHGAAASRCLVGGPGVVEGIAGAEAARAHPDVLAVRVNTGPGAGVRPLRDNWDRLALLAARGPDTATALAHSAELLGSLIDITVRDPDGRLTRATVGGPPTGSDGTCPPVPAGALP